MSKTVFVVMEGSFEYTDEYYYSNGGGEPLKVFLNKEDAYEEMGRLNHRFITTSESHLLAEYFQGANDSAWEECEDAARGGEATRLAYAEKVGLQRFYVVQVNLEPEGTIDESPDFEFSE